MSIVLLVGGSTQKNHFAMMMIFLVCLLNVAHAIYRNKVPFDVSLKELESDLPHWSDRFKSHAKYNKYSYMIFILLKPHTPGWQRCSGMLVKESAVLTAANCIDFPGVTLQNVFLVGGQADLHAYAESRFRLRLGHEIDEKRFGVQERRASKFLIHPKYQYKIGIIVHNIAVIEVDRPFSYKNYKIVPLSLDTPQTTKNCTILGWGLTRGKQYHSLYETSSKVVSSTALGCKYEASKKILLLCIVPKRPYGVCDSDSGSPLICDDKLWGVASHMLVEGRDCSQSLEHYYNSIAFEWQWLESILRTNSGAIRSVEINFGQTAFCAFVSFWISWAIFS